MVADRGLGNGKVQEMLEMNREAVLEWIFGGHNFLDLGCGRDAVLVDELENMQDSYRKAHGSSEGHTEIVGVDAAVVNSDDATNSAKTVEATFDNLQVLGTNKFDRVLGLNTIGQYASDENQIHEHFEQLRAVVANAGEVIVTAAPMAKDWESLERVCKNLHQNPERFKHFLERYTFLTYNGEFFDNVDLKAIISAHGFEVEEVVVNQHYEVHILHLRKSSTKKIAKQ